VYASGAMLTHHSRRSMPGVRRVEQLPLELMPLCFTAYGRLGYWICWTRHIAGILV
jgi:hypothetical protein